MATHTAAFPSVIAAVVSTATPALTVRVVRGSDISDDPADVVMVGTDGTDDPTSAGSFRQTMQTFGGNREEIGEVNGLIVAWNGEADQDAACTTAFGYLASLETAVRATPTLGLTTFDYLFAELSAGDVTESQNNAGATTVLSFTIAYKARI